MTASISFASDTPRFKLPLLHSGQSQKEVFVNEALLVADALLHCSVKGISATPPENSQEGETWVVAQNSSGEWQGRDHAIAIRRGSAWAFMTPQDGTRVFDLSGRCEMLFFGFWRKASLPVEPRGGTSVDGEARAAINDLVTALQALGIIPSV